MAAQTATTILEGHHPPDGRGSREWFAPHSALQNALGQTMKLSRRASIMLLAFGVWTWVIWPTFVKNIWGDPRSFHHGPTSFLLVHVALAALSTVFGTAIAWLGWRALRASRTPDIDSAGAGTEPVARTAERV